MVNGGGVWHLFFAGSWHSSHCRNELHIFATEINFSEHWTAAAAIFFHASTNTSTTVLHEAYRTPARTDNNQNKLFRMFWVIFFPEEILHLLPIFEMTRPGHNCTNCVDCGVSSLHPRIRPKLNQIESSVFAGQMCVADAKLTHQDINYEFRNGVTFQWPLQPTASGRIDEFDNTVLICITKDWSKKTFDKNANENVSIEMLTSQIIAVNTHSPSRQVAKRQHEKA